MEQKNLKNQEIASYTYLDEMYQDPYFPRFLVDKLRAIFLEVCMQIERDKPDTPEALYQITHLATEKTNDLQEEFDENESELETVARECMMGAMHFIAKAYGFKDLSAEDVIGPRDW